MKRRKIKRLLVDAHTFDETHQGIRTFLKGIYSSINVEKDELEVYLAANNIDNLKSEFKNQPFFNYIKLESKNKYKRLAFELPKLIREHKIDYAHFNYFLPLFLNKKCKYIVTIHDVLFIDYSNFFPFKYRVINTLLYKRSARKAEFLTTVSEYSANQIKKHFNIKNKSITILNNAISEDFKGAHSKADDREYIKTKFNIDRFVLYVSRIEKRKNHLALVKAYEASQECKNDISLVFIGKESFNDPDLDEAINKVNELPNKKVIRLSNINNKDLVKFYNAAQLSVFPSICEGFGIPPIESGVLKTPTICSNATAMGDFTFFEENLFDASSKEKILAKMETILKQINSNTISEEYLNQVSNTIKHKYNWSKTALKLKNLIVKS